MFGIVKRAGICIVIASGLAWSVGTLSAREAGREPSVGTSLQGLAITPLKLADNRVATPSPDACSGQTWPNLSPECIAAATGQPARPAPRRIAIGAQ